MKLRTFLILTVFVLLSPALSYGMASFDFPVVEPVVSFVAGDVTVKSAGASGWDAVEVGRILASGDTIKTGPASKAEISCATGKMRLYENTVIIVPEVVDEGDKRDVRAVTLDDGTGLFRIRKRGVENGFEVKTSNIIAGVKGTVFAVLHQKEQEISRVAVYSGVVEVSDTDRTEETKTPLTRGQVMEIEEFIDFGMHENFEPADVWREWKRNPVPDSQILGRSVPVNQAVTTVRQWIEEDGEDNYTCPPVVDNNGNVVVP